MRLRTIRDYDFFEVSSSLQKAIRRNDPKVAGYFGLELFHSNYINYVWKRLLTVSAEDCADLITKEIKSLHDSFLFVNKDRKKGDKPKGRIFLTKAIMILCKAPKSRDADLLQNLVYDHHKGIDQEEIDNYFDEVRNSNEEIPDYAYDIHTRKGKQRGATKKQFIIEEEDALNPKPQLQLFAHLIDRS